MTIQIKDAVQIKSDFITFLRSAIEEAGGPNVTDYNIGSVLNVLVEAFSDVLENYYFDLFQITRDSLENIYNGFNFFKIPGKKALTTISIYIDAPTSSLGSDFFNIPRGTLISTEDGSILFEVTDDYNQPTSTSTSGEFYGKAEYIVRGSCTEAGSVGNVSENALTKFATSITNINGFSYWIRSASASGGTDAESEENMKIRFQKYLISLRRGTKESLEYALATNAAFTGLLYSISEFRFLSLVKQRSTSVGTENYDVDLTLWNKFYPFYSLFSDDDASGTDEFYLYVGSEDKFNNILFSTQSVPAGVDADSYLIERIEYYDSVIKDWVEANVLNISLPSYPFTAEQYLTWSLDSTRWGKFQIRDYSNYFIRIVVTKNGTPSADGRPPLEVYKAMTYPFPGYIDIYCLKNYRDKATINDKKLIAESIDNFKAAGVITTVADATIVNLHPTIIVHTNDLTRSLVPSDINESIRADVITFANTKNVGVDFARNDLYSYIYSRYSQYGNIYIYYRYDPSIYEDFNANIFKEGFKDNVFEAGINEKVDLSLTDVYVVNNINSLINTLTGTLLGGTSPSYSDNVSNYYQDSTFTDLYLAY